MGKGKTHVTVHSNKRISAQNKCIRNAFYVFPYFISRSAAAVLLPAGEAVSLHRSLWSQPLFPAWNL